MTYLNMTTVLQVESSLSSVGEWTCFCSSGKLESTLKSTSPELAQPWEDEHGCKCCTAVGRKVQLFFENTVNGVVSSEKSAAQSGPTNVADKFYQIMKQVNNQEWESKVSPPPIYTYNFLFKNFSTLTYTYRVTCCTYSPKLSSD